MRYKVLGRVKAGGSICSPGDYVDMPEEVGEKLVKDGVLAIPEPVEEPKPPVEEAPVEEPKPKRRGRKKK